MDVLLKVVITLSIFLFIFYGYIRSEEESPPGEVSMTLKILYNIFLLVVLSDVIVFLVYLWRL